jgi:hypothetical protein
LRKSHVAHTEQLGESGTPVADCPRAVRREIEGAESMQRARRRPTPERESKRGRSLALGLCLNLLLAGSAAAAESASSIGFMHGLWIGEGPPILIDACRMQARFGASEPFTRETLRIRDITDGLVVFLIGRRTLVGLFAEDEVTVTGPGISGSARLRRIEPLGARDRDRLACMHGWLP